MTGAIESEVPTGESESQAGGAAPAWPTAGGALGELIRSHDWAATSLGPLGGWTQNLRTATDIVLRSPVAMVLLWGADGIMIYNDAYATFAGRRHPGLLGREVRKGWPEVAAFNDQVMDVGFRGGTLTFKDQELTLFRTGVAERVWMDLNYSPVPDEAGRPAGVLAVVVETTERVLTQRALTAERDRHRGVLGGMAEGFCLLDRDFRILDLNAEALAMETRRREEIVGRTHWDAYPGSRHSEVGRLYERAMHDCTPVSLEHLYEWEDGRSKWLETRAYPVPDGLAVFYRDVTDRKRIETALREREERLRLVVQGAADYAILTLDGERRVTSWSTGAQATFGYRADEVIGLSGDVLFTPEDRADGRPEFEIETAGRDGMCPDVRWHLRKDGTRVFVDGTVRPLRGEDGRVAGFLKVARDETERQRADAALREETRTLETLNRTGTALAAELDLERLVHMVTDAGTSLTGAQFGAYFHNVMDETGERLHLFTLSGADRAAFEAMGRPRATAVFGPTFRNEGVIRSDDILVDPRYGRCEPYHGMPPGHLPVRSYLAVPVVSRSGEVLGGLLFGHPEPGRFSERHERLMVGVASQAAIAIDNARLFHASQREVADRRDAEARLRSSEARLRAIFDAVPVGVVLAEAPSGRIVGGNEQVESILGHPVLPSPDIDRYRDWVAFHADGRRVEGHEFPLARVIVGKAERAQLEVRYSRGDGRASWVRFIAAPVRDESGCVTGGVVAALDIDPERRAEEALRDLNGELERLVEERTVALNRVWTNSRDLLVVVGADGVFRAVNPAWTAILGHQPRDVVGRSFLDFVWPEDAALTQGGLDAAADASDLTNFENRYTHRDGTPRWISWRTSTEGELVYAYGRDVTADKEQAEALASAQEALRQSQKMEAVGQLTGGLAHDFNNLLTGISGSLDLLQKRVAQGRIDELDRYVIAAQGAAKRAAALTHRLLAFSRRQTLDPRPTDVHKLVIGMADMIRRTVGPEITVETVDMVGLWPALVDPPQLENALLNLCINARDAMPDGGRITIETANRWMDERTARDRDVPPGQYLSLCVSDTGSGMPPDVAARAFDPFFTTKPIGMGTGLGLSMIYGFARQSGGQVRIYSEVGLGTMVCVYLPRHYDEGVDVPQVAERSGEAPRAVEGETVLVIDDEPTVRMLVLDVLEDLGYRALEAEDGASGLKILQSRARVDLLVTDVGLPGGMNGRQVADAARVLRPGLRVLFITGYAENAVVGNGHLAPGMAVMTKPFAMGDLAARIRALIEG